MTPEQLAQLFHETYERLAPEYGYETRKETAKSWDEIPADSNNKRLMIAVCKEILQKGTFIKGTFNVSVPATTSVSHLSY